ncbi:sensor histidine kinase [Flavisolibacter nicotianae]|uniref:sensor histidine kinase n=1 Tax=Flavisolibacter nicotianae TaxID=2364882 RepID=UPI000EB3DA5A|nr:sensor histidine kinase [Flavisolibacter nicotianae]
MRKRAFYTNIHFLFVTGGLLLNFLLMVMYSYINNGHAFFPLYAFRDFYSQGWPIMLQTFVVLYLLYYSIRYFNKKYQHNPNGFERFLREILFVLLIGFCIMEFFRWIFITYMVYPEDDMNFLQRKLKMILTIDITFLIVVYAFMTSFRIFRYLQLQNIEVARWQRQYTQSQFEAVKNQLNPHFLFNSLNALSSLVYVDADLAEQFIEKLSRSYRYLLEQRDKQTVPLEQELAFLQSFLFLTEQRFGKKLQVQVANMETDRYTVPPHTLLIVMEQVLQNNTMSAARPLRMALSQEEGTLQIRYSNQPKAATEEQSPQFRYLQEQFHFLNKEISVATEGQVVRMTIPLLPA